MNQRRTKDEPKKAKTKNVRFVKIVLSSLIWCLSLLFVNYSRILFGDSFFYYGFYARSFPCEYILPIAYSYRLLPHLPIGCHALRGSKKTLVVFWGALRGSVRELLLAFTPYTLHFTP